MKMNRKQQGLRLVIIVPLFIFWLGVNSYYFLVRKAGSLLSIATTVEVICLLIMIVASFILTIKIFKVRNWRNKKNYFTLGSVCLALISLYVPQLHANENTFQSPIKIRACYEGTMNTSHLYFRENGVFEDFNIGWFAFVSYRHGTWKQDGDTL